MRNDNKSSELQKLLKLWDERATANAPPGAGFYIGSGRRAIGLGHNSLAFDILGEGLAEHGDVPELIYWSALAAARGGSTKTAQQQVNSLLLTLKNDDPLYSEALSLAGRVAKDVHAKATEPDQCTQAAAESARFYQAAFDLNNDYFPGINAATMTALAGDLESGRAIASRVKVLCEQEIVVGEQPGHWVLASLGEACFLLGEQVAAIGWYQKAAQAAGSRFGDIASMRRQVKLLAIKLRDAEKVLQALAMPGVVVFSGHMIDVPGRADQRFPATISDRVRERIDQELAELDAGFGYCSAACGGDLLFIEAMLARGAEVHVVLPFSREDFLESSIVFAGAEWIDRFDIALKNATSVVYATEEAFLGDTVLFSFTASVLAGMAQLRAQQLETSATMLTVLDAGASRIEGGTRDTVEAWAVSGLPTVNIDLEQMRDNHAVKSLGKTSRAENTSNTELESGTGMSRQIQTMMFADVVGFSKLCEASTAAFFVEFLGRVDKIIVDCEVKPSFCNTWGDGLFVVFDSATAAANFALTLRDMVAATDWISLGLPVNLDIRVGMHTGPVFRAHDPIIKRDNFFGTQVNRAARIEPVAVPGSVMLTEQCACMLAESGETVYSCDYLGIIELAKKFGSRVLYRLRRSSELE